MSDGLSRRKARELTDLLRKNLRYQSPRPVYADPDDERPRWVEVKFVEGQFMRILELINEAGGWVLPPDERRKVMGKHEEQARRAHGDSITYDFTGLSYGDLMAMYQELEDVTELEPFRDAVAVALTTATKEATQ